MGVTVTATQSYSWVIRNVFFDTLKASPFFTGFTARKTKMLQIQPENLPFLGVFIVDEVQLPDGDANAGHIAFIHTLRLAISVMIQNNDDVACEAKLDQAYWAINNTLWRDPYIMNMLDTWRPGVGGNPDNTRVESIDRGVRRHMFGNAGLDNETPIAELQYELTVRHRAEFAPVITDDLLKIHLTTGIKPGETQEQMDQRQQVGIDVDLEPVPEVTPLTRIKAPEKP